MGIGTQIPDQMLTVAGTVHIRNNNPRLGLTDTSVTEGEPGSIWNIRNQNSSLKFYRDTTPNVPQFIIRSNGMIGVGVPDPDYTLHVKGSMSLTDPLTDKHIVRTIKRDTVGYAGGGAHLLHYLSLSTPFEDQNGAVTRTGLAIGSPEVVGSESSYLYTFGGKNIRLGIVNDSYRRSEIELYNDNTSSGEILFRTGAWQDPGNSPRNPQNVRMAVKTDGDIGIGTTSPQSRLDVRSEGSGTQLYLSDDQNDGNAAMGYDSNLKRFAISRSAEGKTHAIHIDHAPTAEAPVFRFHTQTKVDALVVSENGRVGVGEQTPGEALSVKGVIESTTGGIKFPDGTIQTTAAPGAADGVTIINQETATPGGFPILITEKGSYQLMSNLQVPDENTTAIEITADDVTLDLNGFGIYGNHLAGTGIGIKSTGQNTTVTTGTVRGMGNIGIWLSTRSRVTNITASFNGDDGIKIGDHEPGIDK